MNRVELNQKAFYFKIIVQLAVLLYLMVEEGIGTLVIWMIAVASMVLIVNL